MTAPLHLRRLVPAFLLVLMLGSCNAARRVDLPAPTAVPSAPAPSVGAGADPFEPRIYNDAVFAGLGTWLDIFEQGYRHPVHTVERAVALGVTTLYVQTSNFTRPAIRFPGRYGAFIEAEHAHGLSVVAWYLPGLRNVPGDLHKSLAAVRYESPAGQRADGFGLDIEAAEVRSHRARSLRVLLLSRQLRDAVGSEYPLGAITPMPLRIDGRGSYWREFPYAGLAEFYDAILPMNYFTYDVSGRTAAAGYTLRGIASIRAGVGIQGYPIHEIGGISGDMTPEEASGFMSAVQAGHCIGASLYNYSLTTPQLWRRMQPAASAPGPDPAADPAADPAPYPPGS